MATLSDFIARHECQFVLAAACRGNPGGNSGWPLQQGFKDFDVIPGNFFAAAAERIAARPANPATACLDTHPPRFRNAGH